MNEDEYIIESPRFLCSNARASLDVNIHDVYAVHQ